MIRGEITYHDSPSPITLEATYSQPCSRDRAPPARWNPLIVRNVPPVRRPVEGLPAALLEGTYRPQDREVRALQGEFVVQVFDQGEPGSSREEITGDSFSIELIGGAYNGYTRGGYIEGGNVQVES